MADIVTYKAGAYCQIRFSNGERILIGCAQTGIKIMKLGMWGLFPIRSIADWSIMQLEHAIGIFVDPNQPDLHPLDAIKNRLVACSSIAEVQNLCGGRKA